MRHDFLPGDWVQATSQITELMPDGSALEHARPNAIGHVWEVDDEWLNVTFEQTGTTTLVNRAEVKFLCRAEGEKRVAIRMLT